MAGNSSSRLTAVCFLAAFLWLSESIDRHSLIDRPRLSAFFLLLISGALAYVASLFSERLPGADGRFDSEAALLGMKASLPQRPRRFYIPLIVGLVVVRLEIFYCVLNDFHCTVQGVQAFLPVLLAAHEFIFNRRARDESDEPEDMWGSVWEDFKSWLQGSQTTLLFSTVLLGYGAFFVADFAPKSTYFCTKTVDSIPWIVFLQWAGVVIDATIIILLWRVLSWSRTTKSRLRTTSSILVISSLMAGVFWLMSRKFYHWSNTGGGLAPFRGVDSFYVFDILSTGITCTTLAISATLWLCESAPLALSAIVTFIGAVATSIQQLLVVGTYQQTTVIEPLVALFAISWGFVMFIYTNNIRSICYIPRAVLVLLLACVVFTSAAFSLVSNKLVDLHPVGELIYKNRVEADRWLRYATVSTSLKIAVSEYKQRHHGRSPPVNFDKWYDFALQRNSLIIDKFDQIENDILPFWGLTPQQIRDGLEVVKTLPDVGIIKIVDGKAYHNQPADPSHKVVLDEAVSMISSFASYLPEMSIAINLKERPRILVPWEDIHWLTESATSSKLKRLSSSLGRRQVDDSVALENPGGSPFKAPPKPTSRPYVSAKALRHLQALACPPGSKTRAGVSWNTRDLCESCAAPHSQGQILFDWNKSLDPCHQPDIFHLHELHTLPHRYELYQDLLPLFSRSKTDSFNDILIPLIRPNISQEPDAQSFDAKADVIFWQGEPINTPLTHQSLHGGHRNRLVHLVNNSTAADKLPMLRGIRVGKDVKFAYQDVSVREANGPLPFSISFISPENCDESSCQLAQQEFGFQLRVAASGNRYVMLLDSADGPSPDLLPMLRSNSVPLVSSIFKEWFTERLMPWVHFVPIDTRYHGLHTTMAYFFGFKVEGKDIKPRHDDGRWISHEGRDWSEKAIRREDMEVYMFRLLLEYGRTINDDRDSLGFVLGEET